MSKKKRLFWYSFFGIIILMQAYPVERPAVSMDNPNDLIKSAEVPGDVAQLLRSACYDCHSNETVYPWYSYVAPVKWLVYRDTEEGRKELNFSDWGAMKKMDQATALDDISSEVEEGDMPMKIYPLMHPDAKLSDEDRQKIMDWADATMETLFD